MRASVEAKASRRQRSRTLSTQIRRRDHPPSCSERSAERAYLRASRFDRMTRFDFDSQFKYSARPGTFTAVRRASIEVDAPALSRSTTGVEISPLRLVFPEAQPSYRLHLRASRFGRMIRFDLQNDYSAQSPLLKIRWPTPPNRDRLPASRSTHSALLLCC